MRMPIQCPPWTRFTPSNGLSVDFSDILRQGTFMVSRIFYQIKKKWTCKFLKFYLSLFPPPHWYCLRGATNDIQEKCTLIKLSLSLSFMFITPWYHGYFQCSLFLIKLICCDLICTQTNLIWFSCIIWGWLNLQWNYYVLE